MPTFPAAGKTYGGLALDRSVWRRKLPDRKWVVYAAGWVNPNDANTATIAIVYEKDDGSQVTLGTTTQAGAGKVKKTLGPFDLFGTGGVPAGETVPIVRLKFSKNAGVDGTCEAWNLAFDLVPATQ